jgi:hypothetical protein
MSAKGGTKVPNSTGFAQTPGGEQGLNYSDVHDHTIDLCDPRGFISTVNQNYRWDFKLTTDPNSNSNASPNRKPKAAAHYNMEAYMGTEESTDTSTPIEDKKPITETLSSQQDKEQRTHLSSQDAAQPGITSVVSKTAKTTYKAVITGEALTLGYPMSPPNLIEIGGQEAIKSGKDHFISKVVAHGRDFNGNMMTIYATAWKKNYVLNKAPTEATIQSDGLKEDSPV